MWISDAAEVPQVSFGGLGSLLGGDARIKNISHGIKDRVPYIKVEPDYLLPASLTIYHPHSRKIWEIFSKE